MPERGAAVEDKRALIRGAAVRVFAAKGYHACRVSDIAEEAGVAYGLVYHYFGSKEAVLETIFRDTWSAMLTAIGAVEELGEPAPEQVRKVAAIVLRTWRDDPDLVRVLVREVTRSPQLQNEIDEIALAFATLERIIERGKTEGSFRADLDSRVAALMLYGALEEILTGWVMGQLPDGDEDVRAAEHAVAATFARGLAAP
ncbi:MAG TPA: TetR/AcrR family transcriptional regulator [Gaiellaceae bacterium]|nr:TetR/AcrR family transcriptional regulator [Gaiellaceae bacterium]